MTDDLPIQQRRSVSREVPLVQTSQPVVHEHAPRFAPPAGAPQPTPPQADPVSPPSTKRNNSPQEPKPKPTRRRFHLTTSTSPAAFPLKSESGISKRKRPDKPAVATFIETNSRPSPRSNRVDTPPFYIPNSPHNKAHHEPSLPQKKPNASAVENTWCAKALEIIDARPPPPAPTPEIVTQMQQMALEELAHINRHAAPQRDPTKPKITPKVPAQRYADRHPGEATAPPRDANPDTNMDMDMDADYVYDVFVCEPAVAPSIASSSSTTTTTTPSVSSGKGRDDKFGLLVITEDDVPEWQSYALDEEESEKDWNTDEDDENGMCHFLGVRRVHAGGMRQDERRSANGEKRRIIMQTTTLTMRWMRMTMSMGLAGGGILVEGDGRAMTRRRRIRRSLSVIGTLFSCKGESVLFL